MFTIIQKKIITSKFKKNINMELERYYKLFCCEKFFNKIFKTQQIKC